MALFETLRLKFEKSDWALNPEFGLIDSILEEYPILIEMLSEDIIGLNNLSEFGRKDIPSVEQIVRAAIYKELKQLDYRELEYHQGDSRICSQFIKLDNRKPYSFQLFHKYISRISAENLDRVLVKLNQIAITNGLEDISKIRQDSTVVETNIHYPTNNSLVWDCIKESHRILETLNTEISDLDYRNYRKSAKRTYYKINVTKSGDKRADLFKKQLILFTKCINQTANAVKKKSNCSLAAACIIMQLEKLLPLMHQVYNMTFRREIKGETVSNNEKIFSIYELHTDIIVKGGRDVEFGHKINLSSGKSNLILTCEIMRGNPADTELFRPTIEKVIGDYQIIPRDSVTDGGFASNQNSVFALEKGILNIVYNKVTSSLQNIVSSSNIETRLKKWRSAIEANISNLKRGFKIFRCNWKGYEHFKAKVLWSIIAYNIRVMTNTLVAQIV